MLWLTALPSHSKDSSARILYVLHSFNHLVRTEHYIGFSRHCRSICSDRRFCHQELAFSSDRNIYMGCPSHDLAREYQTRRRRTYFHHSSPPSSRLSPWTNPQASCFSSRILPTQEIRCSSQWPWQHAFNCPFLLHANVGQFSKNGDLP